MLCQLVQMHKQGVKLHDSSVIFQCDYLMAVGVAGITFVLRRTGTACFRSAKHSRQVQDVYEQMRSSVCHISTQESSWLYALSILSGRCAFVCLRNTRRVVQQASSCQTSKLTAPPRYWHAKAHPRLTGEDIKTCRLCAGPRSAFGYAWQDLFWRREIGPALSSCPGADTTGFSVFRSCEV